MVYCTQIDVDDETLVEIVHILIVTGVTLGCAWLRVMSVS